MAKKKNTVSLLIDPSKLSGLTDNEKIIIDALNELDKKIRMLSLDVDDAKSTASSALSAADSACRDISYYMR